MVVGPTFDLSAPHGKTRLGAVQRLDLALFVDAQHRVPLGQLQIGVHDVPDRFDEKGIEGELLEALAAAAGRGRVRSDLTARYASARSCGRMRSRARVRGILMGFRQLQGHDALHVLVGGRARRSRAGFVQKPVRRYLATAHEVGWEPERQGIRIPYSSLHRFVVKPWKAVEEVEGATVGNDREPHRRRRPAGIARATSRGANDRGGSLPPQPAGRRGVRPWIFVGPLHPALPRTARPLLGGPCTSSTAF